MAGGVCGRRLSASGRRRAAAVGEAVGRVTAESVWARRSSPAFDSAAGRHRRAGGGDRRCRGDHARCCWTTSRWSTPATRCRPATTPSSCASTCTTPWTRAELRAAVPYQHVRSIGEDISATELLLPEGHRLRPFDVAACAAAGVVELAVRRPGW